MNILRLFILGTAAGAMLLPGAVAARAAAVVSAPPTLAAWSTRVYRSLDDHLVYPKGVLGRYSTGVVAVKFKCSEAGAPADIALYTSSGAHDLDEATLRAMRRIITLHPLPDGMPHNQQFIMRVLFADSPESAAQQIRQISREAATANAWFGKRATAIAGVIELAPPAG